MPLSAKTSRALLCVAGLGFLVGCDPQPTAEPDAPRARRDAFVAFDSRIDAVSPDAGAIPCTDDDGCDDGVDCNGVETCGDGVCVPGTAPSCADDIECTVDTCDLTVGDCVHRAPDGDGDGAGDAACLDARGLSLGTDCDDADARRAPGNLELCDLGGLDEDCNLDTRGGLDADHDGFEDARCCNPMRMTDTRPNCGLDCLDEARSVNPMGTETCNGIDDNCSGVADEICICEPGLTRPCTAGGVCAAGVETCTNGLVWSACSIAPEATDVCDGRDENCNGTVDEGLTIACWRDSDNDGYAEVGRPPENRCPDPNRTRVGRCPVDYTNRAPVGVNADCCDRDARVHPNQLSFHNIVSYCGGYDFDCDGNATQQYTLLATIAGRCLFPTQALCDGADYPSAWLESVPACGVGGTLVTGCLWFPLNPSSPCTFTPAGEIQACR